VRRLVYRLAGAIHVAFHRATGGRIGGRMWSDPVLLLTTTGRKSGKRRTTPLLYGRAGDTLVVVASNGGDPKHPAWHLSPRGAEADVQIGRERRRVRARDAGEGEERERLWAQMVAR
jgi:deazaflavin-dependent oxidoreductase (nitroreductase family)